MTVLDNINPFRVFRERVRVPIETFISQQISTYKKKTDESVNNLKELLIWLAIIVVLVAALLWISVFMYVVFYYTYMPNVTHLRPVHLQFKSCDEQMGLCSFPSAHVQLTKRSQVLMSAQPYRIRLVLDMPESQINKDLGMFMVCAQMRAKGGVLVSSSCRSAMLRYRSRLHQLMRTLMFSPFLLFGFNEEKQLLQVELFSDFEDVQNLPVTDAYVELQSRYAQVYSCELHIEAHFTGLRYFMFNWPKVSAAIGISTNFFFLALIVILSWYHLQEGLPEFFKNKFSSDSNGGDDDNDNNGRRVMIAKVELEEIDSVEEESVEDEESSLAQLSEDTGNNT